MAHAACSRGIGMALACAAFLLALAAPSLAEDLRDRELRPQAELLLFPRAPVNPLTGAGDPICIVQPEGDGLRVTWVRRGASGFEAVRAELLPRPTLVVRQQADVVGRDGTVHWVELAANPNVEPLGWGIWPGN